MLNKLKPKSEFSRNVLTLMTGTTIAQAIPIAISPILTRIYTPEDFGVFAFYMSIVSILAIFATGKYELAIMLPQNDEDAFAIMILSITISFAVSILSFLGIYLFHHQLVIFFKQKEIANWLYLIPISIMLSAIYQNLNYWNNRTKEYKTMSTATILQSTTNTTTNILFGLMNFSFRGMILSNILGNISSVAYLLFRNIKYVNEHKKSTNIKQIITMANLYKQFPLQTLPQNFLYQAYLQIPIVAIKTIFSLTVLGFFTLAYRVIATPLSILSNSLGQVFYQKASMMYLHDKMNLQLYIKSLFIKLLFASLCIGGVLVWFLPELFSFVFGDNWIEAGKIGQYLMIYLIFNFALTPFTKIYLISNHNIFYLKWEILRFASVVLLSLIFYWMRLLDSSLFFVVFSLQNLLLYIILAVPILNKKSFIWREV